MGTEPEELDVPQRGPLGHMWRSTLAGAISGTAVVALGSAVGPIRRVRADASLPDMMAAIPLAMTYAVVAGTIIGIVAGLATRPQRGQFDASRRRRTARILGLVVAVPGGVLLFPLWGVSTSSSVAFVAAMLAAVLYVGVGTYLTAKASLLFVLGADPRHDNNAAHNVGLTPDQ